MTGLLGGIGQVAIPVRDLDRAVAFYRDTLGLPFLFQAPPGLAFFQAGSVRLMLSRPEGGEPTSGGAVIYYEVDDIDAAYGTLAGRGVEFLHPPHLIHRAADHDLWMAFFRDPEENLVGLMCRKER